MPVAPRTPKFSEKLNRVGSESETLSKTYWNVFTSDGIVTVVDSDEAGTLAVVIVSLV